MVNAKSSDDAGSEQLNVSSHPVEPVSEQSRPASLSHKVTTGLAGLVLNTLLQKGLGFISQIMLAWFLTPEDFGLVGMAYSFSALASLLSAGSVKDVLIQRQAELDDLISPAFWMTLAMGIGSAMILAALAPACATWYDNPHVAGLVLVVACIAVPTAMNVVPNALLEVHLRFKAVTVLNLAGSILLPVLTVVLAWAGGGAYSLVVPRLATIVLCAAIAWRISGLRICPSPEFSKWKSLIGSTTLVVLFGFVCSLIPQVDRIALGRFHGERVVGLYFFAFGLSTQIAALLATNLVTVLFPAIAKMQNDPQRQIQAALRASRCIAMIGIPLCLLQAAVARPAIDALFPSKWHDASPILMVLSVSLAGVLLVLPAHSLMRARGMFGTLCWISLAQLAAMASGSFVAAWLGGAVAVATTNALVSLAFAVWFPLAAIRPYGLGWHAFGATYGRSAIIGLCVFAVGACVCWPNFTARYANLLQLCIAGGVGLATHLFLARKCMPADWIDVKARLLNVTGKASGHGGV